MLHHTDSNSADPGPFPTSPSLHGSSKKDLTMNNNMSNNRLSENFLQSGEDAPDNSGKKIEGAMQRGSRFLSSARMLDTGGGEEK